MLGDFLKKFGVGLVAAALSAAAVVFADPQSYTALGEYAVIAAAVGSALSIVILKLVAKLRGTPPA